MRKSYSTSYLNVVTRQRIRGGWSTRCAIQIDVLPYLTLPYGQTDRQTIILSHHRALRGKKHSLYSTNDHTSQESRYLRNDATPSEKLRISAAPLRLIATIVIPWKFAQSSHAQKLQFIGQATFLSLIVKPMSFSHSWSALKATTCVQYVDLLSETYTKI